MTFAEFIKQLTPIQVDTWWNTTVPNVVSEKEEDETWKYQLSKNGKHFPFKRAIKELARYYNIDFNLKDFSSIDSTRNTFCEEFDFDIIEDLIYNRTESNSFIKFHNSLKHTQSVFQEALDYLNKIILSNQIDPYKIRMAIRDSNRQAMVIIGMRAVFSFRENNDKIILALILDKEIYEDNRNNLSVIHEEQFKGNPENQILVTIELTNWNDIPNAVLQSNTAEIVSQYNVIKDTKRATWNSDANTTNSALKYLIFKGENIEEWVKSNNTTPTILNFKQAVEEYRVHLSKNTKLNSRFKIQKCNKDYVFIYDVINGFKDLECHYELIIRNKVNIGIEIHFEEANKNKYLQQLEPHLPEKAFIEKKHKDGFSIAYDTNYAITDKDLFIKIDEALNYLNENLGDRILKIKSLMKENNLKGDQNSKTKNDYGKMELNQIFYGPPGTGKTYHTINEAIYIIDPKFNFNQDRKIIKDRYNELVKEGQIVFTTFHQSMSYEDFIEGIKPKTEGTNVIYNIEDGIFKKTCSKASEKKSSKNFEESYSKFVEEVLAKESITLETPTHKKKFKVVINSNQTAVAIPETEKATNMGVTLEMTRDYIINGIIRDWKPYTVSIGEYIKKTYPVEVENSNNTNKNFVIVIDEINRGNVSQIFGELITLIEEDKRLGKEEALEVTLPYSKEKFGVPQNLHIIGTMNTADRSVEALDTALRRRFSFTEVMPEPELLREIEFKSFNLTEVLDAINQRIELLLDSDHTIGHSYFMKVNSFDTEELVSVFQNCIIPLLQEYFYHDYEKIALILGQGFVRVKENANIQFASFSGLGQPDIAKQFELIKDIEDVEMAVMMLLNKNV